MSLKAKLEAVIYAAEEPVTLVQLAQIFAADALEWKAAQETAAAEASAEFAGESPADAEPMSLIAEGLETLPMADTAAMAAQASQQAAEAALATSISPAEEGDLPVADLPQTFELAPADSDATAAEASADNASSGEPVDAEAEARRIARLRDREIKSILKRILDEIVAAGETDDRGVQVREIAGGYRMATKPECHDAVRLFVKSLKPPMKLSLPALETLAVVAYKQPVTAPEVNEIRGVEAGGVLGSLLARKLIATAGRKPVIGRPILYKTTKEFLLRFGLKDLNELPSMEEFEKMAAADIEEMEPEAVAADAAQTAAEAERTADDATEFEDDLPGDIEPAPAADAPEPVSGEQPTMLETPTDAMSDTPNEQDATSDTASHPPPAEPNSTVPAETEAVPHAEKVEEHRA